MVNTASRGIEHQQNMAPSWHNSVEISEFFFTNGPLALDRRQRKKIGINNEICYPATIVVGDIIRALNSGKYWPRNTLKKVPGKITVEFLDPIPPGMADDQFMEILKDQIDTTSKKLL